MLNTFKYIYTTDLKICFSNEIQNFNYDDVNRATIHRFKSAILVIEKDFLKGNILVNCEHITTTISLARNVYSIVFDWLRSIISKTMK